MDGITILREELKVRRGSPGSSPSVRGRKEKKGGGLKRGLLKTFCGNLPLHSFPSLKIGGGGEEKN